MNVLRGKKRKQGEGKMKLIDADVLIEQYPERRSLKRLLTEAKEVTAEQMRRRAEQIDVDMQEVKRYVKL
jgi:hypothetical protein